MFRGKPCLVTLDLEDEVSCFKRNSCKVESTATLNALLSTNQKLLYKIAFGFRNLSLDWIEVYKVSTYNAATNQNRNSTIMKRWRAFNSDIAIQCCQRTSHE